MSVILFWNVSFTNAQTEQGKIVIGTSSTFGLMGVGSDLMSIGFSNIKYKSDADSYSEPDPDKQTSVNISPKIGFLVANNLLLGIDFNLAYSKNTDGSDDYKYTQSIFGAGPFIRYYIPTNSIKPFIEANSSFGSVSSKSEYNGNTNDDSERLISLGGGIGMAVPIGSKVTFDVMANYSSLSLKETKDNDDNFRTIVGTFGIKLGFLIYLGN